MMDPVTMEQRKVELKSAAQESASSSGSIVQVSESWEPTLVPSLSSLAICFRESN